MCLCFSGVFFIRVCIVKGNLAFALRLDCFAAAPTTSHQKVLLILKLVELKMLDFSELC